MVSVLLAFAPLILKLFDLFISDVNARNGAKARFLAIIQGHINDAQKSVDAHKSAQQQLDELKKGQQDGPKIS